MKENKEETLQIEGGKEFQMEVKRTRKDCYMEKFYAMEHQSTSIGWEWMKERREK